MKLSFILIAILSLAELASADLKYEPIQIQLSTDKTSYVEGEKITFLVTITNTDKENTYPVLLPHTQNTGQKLFYLNLYDKANNTLLLRATENRNLNMMVHDTGTVKIKYLKPQEQVVIPIYINDFENYFSYHTQNSSHHSFGVPLFAGIYKVNLCYNPNGIALGDSIYEYYGDFDHPISKGKFQMHEYGLTTHFIELNITRSEAKMIKIEGNQYFITTDGHRYMYYKDSIGEGGSNPRLAHVTNLPSNTSSLNKGEYYYSHFPNLYAEYIVRFDDGDIKEYRKYRDLCPDYLYTESYNDLKQLILFAQQLPDGRFYSVTYNQPGNTMHKESYCSADGTLCHETLYKLSKNGTIKKEISKTSPCSEMKLEGKKRSVYGLRELAE